MIIRTSKNYNYTLGKDVKELNEIEHLVHQTMNASELNGGKIENFIRLNELDKPCRKREKVMLRTIICGIYKQKKGRRYNGSEVARIFKKDHSTIIYAQRQFKDLLEVKDKVFMEFYNKHYNNLMMYEY